MLQVANETSDFDPLLVGNALRREIRIADVSYDVIGHRVGVSSGHLSRVLRGFRVLTPEMADRIRAAIADLSEATA